MINVSFILKKKKITYRKEISQLNFYHSYTINLYVSNI